MTCNTSQVCVDAELLHNLVEGATPFSTTLPSSSSHTPSGMHFEEVPASIGGSSMDKCSHLHANWNEFYQCMLHAAKHATTPSPSPPRPRSPTPKHSPKHSPKRSPKRRLLEPREPPVLAHTHAPSVLTPTVLAPPVRTPAVLAPPVLTPTVLAPPMRTPTHSQTPLPSPAPSNPSNPSNRPLHKTENCDCGKSPLGRFLSNMVHTVERVSGR